jgi:ceramide glucosyltransferase
MPTPIGLAAAILGLTVSHLVCQAVSFAGPPAFVALFGLGAYITALALFFGWLVCRRRESRVAEGPPTPRGVSILKPLCGLDDDLESNLETFLSQDHVPLQILVGVRDPMDPALKVARDVADRHPGLDVSFVVGVEGGGANPKIAIDEKLLPLVKHPLVLLSDSNVRMESGELAELVEPFDRGSVGMVYQPVVSIGERNWTAALGNLLFTEQSAVLTIAIRVFCGQDPITGKGMLCRREALTSIGDLSRLRDVGMDDYALGVLLKQAGWELEMSTVPAKNVHTLGSWSGFVDRQLRHAVWRASHSLWFFFAELFMTPLLYSLMALVIGGPYALTVALVTMIVKFVLEDLALTAARGRSFAWRHRLLMPLKDAFRVGIGLISIFKKTVVWRGREYRVGPFSLLKPPTTP